MKLGFSTSTCPSWDLATVVAKAREYGYAGVELSAPPAGPGPDAEETRRLFADSGVEAVCVASEARLDEGDVARAQEDIARAAKLSCPLVRVPAGRPSGSSRQRAAALGRTACALASLAPQAAAAGVTIVVENGDGAVTSRDLWQIVDTVRHPAVRCCWNEYAAALLGERPTLTVPRIAAMLGLVHVCDARIGPDGRAAECTAPGEGNVPLSRLLTLLRGVAYEGYVVLHWPGREGLSAAQAESILPAARTTLEGWINAKGKVLTAYKGDDTLPKYVRPARPLLVRS